MQRSHDPEGASPTDALLADSDWLRRLARRLLKDPNAAEDAVQDTLLAALRQSHPERAHARQPERNWLAKVLRNEVRQQQRSSRRRADHEALVPGRAASSSAADTAQRIDMQRKLVDAIATLDEPMRTAIVMRFFDGLPPREIARRTEAPVKTVHSRIERGLARLRAKLDREFGDRSAWVCALAPLAERTLSAWPLTLLTLTMNVKLQLAAVAALITIIGILSSRGISGSGLSEPTSGASLSSSPAALEIQPVAEFETQREVLSAEPRVVQEQEDLPIGVVAELPLLTGRVLDASGQAVAGVVVSYEEQQSLASVRNTTSLPARILPAGLPSARSAADGSFELLSHEKKMRVISYDEDWVTVYAPIAGPETGVGQELLIIVAPRRNYAGIVLDDRGQPLDSALVTVVAERDLRSKLVAGYLTYATREPAFLTEEGGQFSLDAAGYTVGASLRIDRTGFERLLVPLPESSDFAMRLVMRPLDSSRLLLRGSVVDGMGAPVSGAHVSGGQIESLSDEQGNFLLEIERDTELECLRAAKRGFLPAEEFFTETPDPSVPITLTMGGPPLKLRGRVVDDHGEPVPGALVWSLDKSRFGLAKMRLADMDMTFERSIEELIDPASGGQITYDRTADDAGRFFFTGMLPREYRLVAMDPTTLAFSSVVSYAGDEQQALLRIRPEAQLSTVAGHVVTLDGEPLAGVRIRASRDLVGGGGETLKGWLGARETTSDKGGHFAFDDLVIEDLMLSLSGEIIADLTVRPSLVSDDMQNLVLRVPAKCFVRVELPAGAVGDGFQLLDREGNRLMLTSYRENMSLGSSHFELQDGRSAVLETDTSARTLLIMDGGGEVSRTPISLVVSREVQVLSP